MAGRRLGARDVRASGPAVALVGMLLLAGCATSSTPPSAVTSSSPASARGGTPIPASLGVLLTQAQTEAALPGASALSGGGWTAQRTTTAPSAVTTGPSVRVRSDCTASGALALAALPDHAPVTEAEVHLATGSGSSAQAAGVQILSYADELGVADLARVEQAIDECAGFTVTLADGSTVPATLSPLAIPTDLGDAVFGVRATYTAAGSLQFEDIAHVVIGHTLINLLQVGAGSVGTDVVPALATATVAQLESATSR